MFATSAFVAILAASGFAAAVPAKRQQGYGTSINAVTSSGLDPNKVLEPIPAQFNSLVGLGSLSLSSAILDVNATYGVDPSQVLCQFFKDAQGVQPAGLFLTAKSSPIELTTNLVEVESVICIVQESGEA